MKKFFVVFVCILTAVVFLSSAWAIDRAPKNKDSDKKEKTTELKKMTQKKAKSKPKTGTFSKKIIRTGESKEKIVPKKSEKTKGGVETKKSKERYDYFIDRNNNGIDDRLEKDTKAKHAKEQKVIKEKTPVPSEKAPAKVSPSTKTSKKVKETKVSEQKKETKIKKTEEKRKSDKR